MTSFELNEFNMKLFENEIFINIKDLLLKISDKFNIDKIELDKFISEHLDTTNIDIIDDKNYKIIRKNKNHNIDDKYRCNALINKNDVICQCSKKKSDNSNYCFFHDLMYKSDKLPYGSK